MGEGGGGTFSPEKDKCRDKKLLSEGGAGGVDESVGRLFTRIFFFAASPEKGAGAVGDHFPKKNISSPCTSPKLTYAVQQGADVFSCPKFLSNFAQNFLDEGI